MERIGKQQEAVRDVGILRREHGRLPPAVGMAAEEDRPRHDTPQSLHGAAEPGAVRGAAVVRWPGRALLPERQIAAEHGDARGGERLGGGGEQGRGTVAAGAMRQHQAFPACAVGPVQEAADAVLVEVADAHGRGDSAPPLMLR